MSDRSLLRDAVVFSGLEIAIVLPRNLRAFTRSAGGVVSLSDLRCRLVRPLRAAIANILLGNRADVLPGDIESIVTCLFRGSFGG